MARMIPPVISATAPEAEKKVYARLRDALPDDYIVFHSFDLLTPAHKGHLVDGEIDFLILFPNGDLLVLEVKGGVIDFDCTAKKWLQNGKPIKFDPFGQVKTNKYAIRDFLRRRLNKEPWCAYGHCVCFPDETKDLTELPSGAEKAILLNHHSLPYIREAVEGAMDAFREKGSRRLSAGEIDDIRNTLMPVFEGGFDLSDKLALAERRIFSLTEEQCRMLEFIRNQRRVLIQGCAGSGKSVMAIKKARELASDPKCCVLLLAWNEMISDRLTAAVDDLPNVTAINYHGFCLAQLRAAGCLPEPRPDDPRYWDEELPNAFNRLLTATPLLFDAVIVDEGQDFRAAYWRTIDALVRPDGWFYIFFDPGQNVRDISANFPVTASPFVLQENCRNTQRICTALAKHAPFAIISHDRLPAGEDVVEVVEPLPEGRRKRLGEILDQLVNKQGITTDRIVIIGGHSLANTCLGGDPQAGKFTVTDSGESGPLTVCYYTYLKFKGCEADAVILLDVDSKDPRWNREGLYTAMSRAKHLLYIIYETPFGRR